MLKIVNKLVLYCLTNITMYMMLGSIKHEQLKDNSGNVLIFIVNTILKKLKIKRKHIESYFDNFYYYFQKYNDYEDKLNLHISFKIILNKPYYWFDKKKSDEVRESDKLLFDIVLFANIRDSHDSDKYKVLSEKIKLSVDFNDTNDIYNINLFNDTFYLHSQINNKFLSYKQFQNYKETVEMDLFKFFIDKIDDYIDISIRNLIINSNETMVKREFNFINEPDVSNQHYSHNYLSALNKF